MKIIFLLHRSAVDSASTILRGVQLAELMRRHPITCNRDIETTCDPLVINNSFVYLTKGAFRRFDLDVLVQLRQRGNILVADPIDDMIRSEAVPLLDGLVAASLQQARHLRTLHRRIPIHHITHGVDHRIPALAPPDDEIRIAYVGERINARYSDRITAFADIVHTDTSRVHVAWIANLSKYNCHYIVRQQQNWDGHKPFTKGFVAAHCGCPVIAERTEGDALEYLSDDYPYFVDGTTFETLRDDVGRIAKSFDSGEWRLARHIMNEVKERSSSEYIFNEILRMIKFYV